MSVKERFVKDILVDEGARLKKNQGIAIGRQTTAHTGNLHNRRKMQVKASGDYDGKLTFTHTAKQRFLDLKKRTYGEKVVKSKRRIHNNFIYGHRISIYSRMLYDLTDDVVAKYKELEK